MSVLVILPVIYVVFIQNEVQLIFLFKLLSFSDTFSFLFFKATFLLIWLLHKCSVLSEK